MLSENIPPLPHIFLVPGWLIPGCKWLCSNQDQQILLYGKNSGLKKEVISTILLKKPNNNITVYEEKEILDNKDIFFENISSNSLFEKEKTII